MKRFSEFMESCVTADVNQGNAVTLGVTNHLTPVNNIVTNVKNLFSTLPIVVSVGEDGVSVKINSSKFVTKEDTNKILYEPVWQANSVASYIISQGLDSIKLVNLGMYFIAYFYPSDIKFAEPAKEPEKQKAAEPKDNKKKKAAVKEQFLEEAELDSFITESDDDEELKDLTKEKISELIKSDDKVKAAKQLELLVGQEMELPREYYFAGVKDKQGNESIALRWKYTVKRPKGMTAELTKTLINIFDDSKEGIWVGDFDEDSMFQLPDEVKKLIESILEFLGAEKTNDPCVWSLEGKGESSDKKEDDKKEGEDNKDDKPAEGNDKKEESEDVEDDKSRDELDNLLK